MRLFEVKKISYYPPNRGYCVHLLEINGDLQFPIVIGGNEVQSIALALEGIRTPRPMTHDIILDILNSINTNLDKVEIHKFFKGTFLDSILKF